MSELPTTCARCGAAADAGHDFCPKCGASLKTAPPAAPAGPPPLPRKPFPLLLVVLCALAGVAVIVAGIALLASEESDGKAISITVGKDAPGAGSSEEGPVLGGLFQDHPLSGTFHCRKGAEFDVDPEDAAVAIDDVVIGLADDFDGKGGGRTYYFRGPGTYIVRLSMKGYRTAWVKVIVSSDAAESVVSVDTKLRER